MDISPPCDHLGSGDTIKSGCSWLIWWSQLLVLWYQVVGRHKVLFQTQYRSWNFHIYRSIKKDPAGHYRDYCPGNSHISEPWMDCGDFIKRQCVNLVAQLMHKPWPVNSPHKDPVTRKIFPFDDAISMSSLRTKNIVRSKRNTTTHGLRSFSYRASRLRNNLVNDFPFLCHWLQRFSGIYKRLDRSKPRWWF